MKVILSTNNGVKPSKNATLLPLIPTESRTLTKDNSVGLQLATDPVHMVTSPKFKMLAYILKGDEDVRTVLTWKKDLEKIFHGLALNDETQKHQMVENLLTDTALTLYSTERDRLATATRATAAQAAETTTAGTGAAILAQPISQHLTDGDVHDAIKVMISGILPRRVLARAKRENISCSRLG